VAVSTVVNAASLVSKKDVAVVDRKRDSARGSEILLGIEVE